MPVPMLRMDEAALKDMSGQWRAFMGITQQGGDVAVPEGISQYARVPADEAWVYSCINRRAQAAQSVPLRVYVREGSDRIAANLTTNQAARDLQFLLDNVNSDTMTGSDLKSYTEAGMCVWGEGYWKKVRGVRGGAPKELWWLRAPDVTVKKMAGGRIAGYGWRDGQFATSASEEYKTTEVVPFRTWNLEDPTRGLSPLSAVRWAINTNQQASIQVASVLANWGIPAGAWVAPKGAELGPQDQSAIRRALRSLRGPRNQGKTPVLPEGLDWKQLALNPKDAEWLNARKVSRMEVCAALGVPLVLAGDDEKNTVYSGSRDAERIFWRSTMIPELDHLADAVNNWLVPDFDPTRQAIDVAFDYSEIEALQEPLSMRWTSWIEAIDRMVVTPNMFINEFKLGKPVPWGDEPVPHTRVTLSGLVDSKDVMGGGNTPPAPRDVVVTTDDESSDQTSVEASLRSIVLYQHPAVRAFLADRDTGLDTEALLGVAQPIAVRHHLERGLIRRYSPQQLIDGVPSERFPPLNEVIR